MPRVVDKQKTSKTGCKHRGEEKKLPFRGRRDYANEKTAVVHCTVLSHSAVWRSARNSRKWKRKTGKRVLSPHSAIIFMSLFYCGDTCKRALNLSRLRSSACWCTRREDERSLPAEGSSHCSELDGFDGSEEFLLHKISPMLRAFIANCESSARLLERFQWRTAAGIINHAWNNLSARRHFIASAN